MERYELENHRDMVLDIINILGHNPYENKLIKMIKNHQPSKGEKGRQG